MRPALLTTAIASQVPGPHGPDPWTRDPKPFGEIELDRSEEPEGEVCPPPVQLEWENVRVGLTATIRVRRVEGAANRRTQPFEPPAALRLHFRPVNFGSVLRGRRIRPAIPPRSRALCSEPLPGAQTGRTGTRCPRRPVTDQVHGARPTFAGGSSPRVVEARVHRCSMGFACCPGGQAHRATGRPASRPVRELTAGAYRPARVWGEFARRQPVLRR